MNKHIHKTAQYIALILISSMNFSIKDVFAETDRRQTVAAAAQVEKNSSEAGRRILAEKKQQVIVEARDALSATVSALEALEAGHKEDALALLRIASGKLDAVLAKKPELALVPAAVEVDVADFQGDSAVIKQEIDRADNLLDDGKVQEARNILSRLVSEIRINMTNIPLVTYPMAIKDATLLIENGKTDDAVGVLYSVLNLLEKNTEVIPLPVLNAEELLTQASELEHKDDLSKQQNRAEVMRLVDAAKAKLQLAELLGYGNKDNYKTLYAAIDDIKSVLHTEQESAAWENVKRYLSELKKELTSKMMLVKK